MHKAASRFFRPRKVLQSLAWLAALLAGRAQAQAADAATAQPPTATATLQTVEVTGVSSETEERRRSTASKIIFGRDEIDRFGDSTVGEILKRLPGVTLQGRPGRGGVPSMRGLAGGYTQILIDGERAPRGFSLDDLSPEQVERIEILRAPTAETGSRAIGGTINIITRGGYSKRVNELRLGQGLENGHQQPTVAWTRNDTQGRFNYNLSLSANRNERANDVTNLTHTQNLVTGELTDQSEVNEVSSARNAIHANARLQWRDERGSTLVLMPMLVLSDGGGHAASQLQQEGGVAPYTHSAGTSDTRFSTGRLAGQWTYRLEQGGNVNLRFGLGQSEWVTQKLRTNFDVTPGVNSQQDTGSQQHDTSFSSSAKITKTLDNAHSLVSGMELDLNRRVETATTVQNGETPLSDFDGDLTASSLRSALYVQDEWALTPQWALHTGLRWEGIATRGSIDAAASDVSNRSSVLTPLLHAVWKPWLESRDQMRMSLTRSYRSPDLQNLIARPIINSMYAVSGPNEQIHPDRAGNPDLKPELATGLDVAFERYLAGSGILSANVFFRSIQNLMRSETALEAVSWASVPRWVARMQNIGNATTHGLELEAKFRLSDLVQDAPKLDFRSNASLFSSRVSGVPGPNNRLSQQPNGTLNLGADYRIPQWPLTVGGNFNWTPGYSTRLTAQQSAWIASKHVGDAYVLWTINTSVQLRVSASNLAPHLYATGGALNAPNALGQGVLTTTELLQPSYTSWQARLEIKL
jgi:iron complex outermembrane receptor protein